MCSDKNLKIVIVLCLLAFIGCRNTGNTNESIEQSMPQNSNGEALDLNQKCGEIFDANSIPEFEVKFSDPFISKTINFELNIPANKVASAIQFTNLEKFLPKTAKVPGVSGTKLLIGTHFGPTGSRRLVCLTDHSYAAEEVIENKSDREFKYKVWNYTSEVAKPIEYAVGEFIATPLTANKSMVKWTYSFKLKNNVFPGNLFAPGRLLFRKSFVDSDYTEFMMSAANAMKINLVVPNVSHD